EARVKRRRILHGRNRRKTYSRSGASRTTTPRVIQSRAPRACLLRTKLVKSTKIIQDETMNRNDLPGFCNAASMVGVYWLATLAVFSWAIFYRGASGWWAALMVGLNVMFPSFLKAAKR